MSKKPSDILSIRKIADVVIDNSVISPLDQSLLDTSNNQLDVTFLYSRASGKAIAARDMKYQFDAMARAMMRHNPFVYSQSLHGAWLEEKPDPNRACPKSDVALPTDILPGDGRAVGYITGFRAWRFNLQAGMLASDTFDENSWKPKQPQRAVDKNRNFGKGAGIYAAKQADIILADYERKIDECHRDYGPAAFLGVVPEKPILVIGKVALWGAIKEHTAGYRAEWAYPIGFLKILGVAKHIELPLLRAISEIYLPRR